METVKDNLKAAKDTVEEAGSNFSKNLDKREGATKREEKLEDAKKGVEKTMDSVAESVSDTMQKGKEMLSSSEGRSH